MAAISFAVARPGASASGQITMLRPASGVQSVCLTPCVRPAQDTTALPVSRASASRHFSSSTTIACLAPPAFPTRRAGGHQRHSSEITETCEVSPEVPTAFCKYAVEHVIPAVDHFSQTETSDYGWSRLPYRNRSFLGLWQSSAFDVRYSQDFHRAIRPLATQRVILPVKQ